MSRPSAEQDRVPRREYGARWRENVIIFAIAALVLAGWCWTVVQHYDPLE